MLVAVALRRARGTAQSDWALGPVPDSDVLSSPPSNVRQVVVRAWKIRLEPSEILVSKRDWSANVSTYSPKPGDITRVWHVIDAEDIVLGRLAVATATLLRGKHKPTFAPHVDGGDFVIVVNASKIALTGSKRTDKLAYRHSGRPGGLRSVSYGTLLDNDPRKAVELAVWGMLPKNRLSRQLITKLKVYAGPEHPHSAQQPHPFTITQLAQ